MEVCPTCERIIPDAAMVCEHCGVSAARPFAELPSEFPSMAAPVPDDPLPVERGGLGWREVLMIAAAVIGSGAITLAMLSARGSVTATAAAPGDAMPAAVSASAPAFPLDPAAAPGWIENRAQWTGGDRRSLAFELPSRNETPVWMRNVRPHLVVRCAARRTDVFVFTDSAAAMEARDEDHTVRVAFDDEPERTQRWPDSVAHDALFAPDGAGFAQQLIRARTMRFGYTPHNAAPVVAHFDVRGLAERLAPAAALCGSR